MQSQRQHRYVLNVIVKHSNGKILKNFMQLKESYYLLKVKEKAFSKDFYNIIKLFVTYAKKYGRKQKVKPQLSALQHSKTKGLYSIGIIRTKSYSL